MTWVGRAPQKVHFCRLETLKKQILKLLPQKGEQRLYFTQLFVLSSNFELKIINFDLAVPIRGETGAWIGVYCGPTPGFSHQNCLMLSIFEYILVDFCLGYSNDKCQVLFLTLIFLLWTFLFFWWNHYEAIQPVKTTIFNRRKIAFEQELASYQPVFLHYSWIFDSGTLVQNCFS